MGGVIMIISILVMSVLMYLEYIKIEPEVIKNFIPLVLVLPVLFELTAHQYLS